MSILTVSVRWLLVGYCGLTLLHLTDATTKSLQITQKPRFYGLTTGRKVGIYCLSSKQHLPSTASWYKASEFNSKKLPIQPGDKIKVWNRNLTKNGILVLLDLRLEDQGVYFCKIDKVFGPGTEVQVTKPVNIVKVLYRSEMKDGLIILQGLLLAMFIAAFVFRKKTLTVKKESIYEEPEVDHIYEGLAIETCEGDLYEEISVYAQPEGAEAPWE
ncbi:B-cell antigen receptor complex-associated protein beta chain [Periophthalmus magnuspinnatus]|uniref:Ig-like domain-containing protein n=1 Tax=Periophthalmus magnuspinnatus TaxID=409849 RepID=A0A3B4AM75_9GOBI|nr:B-cell antigen receptor complex-associated protein beta chain [Periophthalmus magnuspinnatus]